MKEKICIYKETEHVIINALNAESGRKLSAGQIKAFAKIYTDESDQNIQKKIERMAEKNYLKKEKISKTKALYYLNTEIEFLFEGMPLEPKERSIETETPERIEHTSDLKDAIRTWIYDFSEPSQEHPFAGGRSSSDVIEACESNVLFPDLANHLPNLGSTVCSGWNSYKEELKELDGLKDILLSSVEDMISKCFESLKLAVVYTNGGQYYECYLIQNIVYNIVIGLETGQEGYDEYMKALDCLQCRTPIFEGSEHVFWGEYLMVPAKDRDLLKAGVARFLVFFEDIVADEICSMGSDVAAKVNLLKPKREKILRELDRILKYANFPGECEYLN